MEQRLRDGMAGFTPAERRLVSSLLGEYPVSGLGTVTELAEAAGVSSATVVRMARKLGYDGFPDLQRALKGEVAARIANPMVKRARWGDGEGHSAHRFAAAVSTNVGATLARLDMATFDAVAALLADADRPVFVSGGRITRPLAEYLAAHLQMLRPGVASLSPGSVAQPQVLLELRPGAVLIVFDIRRYEAASIRLARLAQERGARIVLFTDPWISPVARHAAFQLSAAVEVPSSWDSTVALLLLVEALIAATQDLRWDESRARLQEMEAILAKTRLFRDPP